MIRGAPVKGVPLFSFFENGGNGAVCIGKQNSYMNNIMRSGNPDY